MKILAIETSCDDTCASIVEASNDFKIVSNVVSSQVKLHQKYGGVYPKLAKREHQKNIIPILTKALVKAKSLQRVKGEKPEIKSVSSKLKILEKILEREPNLFAKTKKFLLKYQKQDIELIAVTKGPGLEPCLWVGVNIARAISFYWGIPIIGVNHIEAHILANWLRPVGVKSKIKNQKSKILFPSICLVVSGGHTQLILMKDFFRYKILGETRDDAAGEAFDKTARILGLPYPGGPAIAGEAAKLSTINNQLSIIKNQLSIKLPRPMLYSKDFDFSFSGLKTAVLYDFKKRPKKIRQSRSYKIIMAAEIQEAIIEVLVKKTIRAAKQFGVKSIILGGGVTANKRLREAFVKEVKRITSARLFVPEPRFSTDNAAMVAITGYLRFLHFKRESWKNLSANANLRIE